MKVYNLIYIFMFIMLIGFVSSVTPFTQTTDKGLIIEYPKLESLRQDAPFELEVHVFNSTTGQLQTAPSVSCVAHVYNHVGVHVANQKMTFDIITKDYETTLNANNFTASGEYSSIIQCNSSLIGGFASFQVLVSPNGEVLSTARAVGFGIAGICIAFCIGFIFFIFLRTQEYWVKGLTFGGLWIFFLIWNYGFFVFAINYLWSISYLGIFFKWIFIVQLILTFPMMLGMIVFWLYTMVTNKYMMNMLKHGVAEDRAISREMRRR